MNRVFYVEELVQRIALNADDRSVGSASLLALACCCKALEDPVMDVLWQRQRILHVIIKTLPADCWTVTDSVYVSGIYLGLPSHSSKSLTSPHVQRIIRTPTPNEWERFRRYTARVVRLSVGLKVSSETVSFLGTLSTLSDPLWPRLTSLSLVRGLGWDAATSALGFLSPKITKFTLILPRDDNILLQPILSTASDRCHQIQELALDVVADNSHCAQKAGELIYACRDTLHTLCIWSPLKAEYFPIIANLPRLRILSLLGAHPPCDLPLNAFPALENVSFSKFHGQGLQHFFKRLCTTGLEVVDVEGTDTIAFKELIATLLRFSATLRFLHISPVSDTELPSGVVPRLFANLRTVSFGCSCWVNDDQDQCAFRLTDQAIAELGAAMPNITDLYLGNIYCPSLQPTAFLSLVSLSKTCKDLESLTIKVDFRTMIAPSLDESEDGGADATVDGTQGNAGDGCKLRDLDVGLSTLSDHPESGWIVAIGLGKIFPSLPGVAAGYGSSRSEWVQVRRNIGMLRRVFRTVQW